MSGGQQFRLPAQSGDPRPPEVVDGRAAQQTRVVELADGVDIEQVVRRVRSRLG